MSISDYVKDNPLRKGDSGMGVKMVQLALRAADAEVADDGVFGSVTEAAVKSFQNANKLTADGVVGQKTADLLDRGLLTTSVPAAMPSVMAVAPWLSMMRAITGTKEFAGGADNPTIISWAKEVAAAYPELKGTVGWYDHDSIPWCGLAVALCMVRAGKRPPAMPLGAGNWFTSWPDGNRLNAPCLGAVGIRKRTGGHHVFLYEGENQTHYFGRSGNQSDQVNVSLIVKDTSLLGWMWPNGEPRPQGGRVFTSFANAKAGAEA